MKSRDSFRTLSIGVLGFMLFVIVWGALVRATGSGAGCGSDWPMCRGAVIPRATGIETYIEFFHRITSGIALVLVLAQFMWARNRFPRGAPVRKTTSASLLFILLEALLGAGLVIFEYVAQNASLARGVWVSAHLVNTFLLIGSLALTVAALEESTLEPLVIENGRVYRMLAAIGLLATMLVGISGAITALGDTLFPSSSILDGFADDLSPSSHLFIRLRLWHPVLALIVAGFLFGVSVAFARLNDKTIRRRSIMLITLLVAQLGLGFANVALLAPLALQLLHLLVADGIWILLAMVGYSTLLCTSQTNDSQIAHDTFLKSHA